LKFRPSELLTPHDFPELTELLTPSLSEVPVEDDRPVVFDFDFVVLREMLSLSDTLSLAFLTSRMISVSPISLETYAREKWSSRLKNIFSPELARKVSQLSR